MYTLGEGYVGSILRAESMAPSFMHTYIRTHTQTHTHTHTYTHIHKYMMGERYVRSILRAQPSFTYFYLRTHTHKRTHTHTNTHTYIYAYSQVYVGGEVCWVDFEGWADGAFDSPACMQSKPKACCVVGYPALWVLQCVAVCVWWCVTLRVVQCEYCSVCFIVCVTAQSSSLLFSWASGSMCAAVCMVVRHSVCVLQCVCCSVGCSPDPKRLV